VEAIGYLFGVVIKLNFSEDMFGIDELRLGAVGEGIIPH
jgi:hypothetical protein